jgi:hypothetical protein
VLQLYKQISGKELDLTNLPEDADDSWLMINQNVLKLLFKTIIL